MGSAEPKCATDVAADAAGVDGFCAKVCGAIGISAFPARHLSHQSLSGGDQAGDSPGSTRVRSVPADRVDFAGAGVHFSARWISADRPDEAHSAGTWRRDRVGRPFANAVSWRAAIEAGTSSAHGT